MNKLKYVKLELPDGSYSASIPLSVDSEFIDVDGIDLRTSLSKKANKTDVEQIETEVKNKANKEIATALFDDLQVQKRRIDNLAHLNEASTTGDAELTDIRTGLGGVQYASAGEALRKQIEMLSKESDSQMPLNLCWTSEAFNFNSTKRKISGSVIDGIYCEEVNNLEATDPWAIPLTLLEKPIHLEGGNTYRFYDKMLEEALPVSFDTYMLDIRDSSHLDNILFRQKDNHGNCFYIENDVDVVLYLRVGPNYRVSNMYIYPVIEKILNEKENNLIDPMMLERSLKVGNLTVTSFQDGSLTINGITEEEPFLRSIIPMNSGFYLEANETYLISSNNDSNIIPSNSTYRLVIRSSETTDILAYEDYDKGILFTPSESGLYRLGLVIPVDYECDFTIKPSVINIKNLQDNNFKQNKIRVCAYNVGNFAYGNSGRAQGTNEMYVKFLNAFKKINADVYMFSEWDEYWNEQNDILSNDILGKLKRYHSTYLDVIPDRYTAQMNYSNIPFRNEYHEYYVDGESRYFTDNVCLINNKPVHFICTHFPWSSQSLRQDDITKLLHYIDNNNIKTYVIGGDFNLGLDPEVTTQEELLEKTKEDISLLESYGSISVQGNMWGPLENEGLFNTVTNPPQAMPIYPLDNLIVSSDIDILNVNVIESDASDHFPLVVDLQIN